MAEKELRLTDALIGDKAMGRYALGRPMIDPRFGGQNGYTTDYPSFINHEAYVQGNLIIKVLAVPRGFSHLQMRKSGSKRLRLSLNVKSPLLMVYVQSYKVTLLLMHSVHRVKSKKSFVT